MRKDFFAGLGLDYILFIGHQLPDRDVACAEYMFCEAHGLSWKDARIRLLFVKNGEEYTENGFFHTDRDEHVVFVDWPERLKKQEATIVELAAELTQMQNDPDRDYCKEQLDAWKSELDGAKQEFARSLKSNQVLRQRVLIIHFDTGRKYLPLTSEEFKNGVRVFYYDHHGEVDNGISATGLVFRAHKDRLQNSPRFEHLQIMADFIDAKEYGRDFDGRSEFEMRNLYGLADLLRGLNYLQTGERTKKDDAYFGDALIGAFYALDSFMSVRLMFGRNLTEARRGVYETPYGVRVYYHNFSGTGINGQTVRIFFGRHVQLGSGDRVQVDCIVTKHRERLQVVIYRDEFKKPEYLDTAEILRRLRERCPSLLDEQIYLDSRDFCLYITSSEVELDDLLTIVEQMIEERRDAFVSLMVGDSHKLEEEIERIASLSGTTAQAAAWRTFYHDLPTDKQILALRLFMRALSAHGHEETSSMILEQ